MAVNLTEGRHALEFLLSEAEGSRSRDAIIVASGQGKLSAGSVLGKITASGKYVLSTTGAADGSQTAAAVLAYPVDATSADAAGVGITRDAEVNSNALIYDASVNSGALKTTKNGQLATQGIIAR